MAQYTPTARDLVELQAGDTVVLPVGEVEVHAPGTYLATESGGLTMVASGLRDA